MKIYQYLINGGNAFIIVDSKKMEANWSKKKVNPEYFKTLKLSTFRLQNRERLNQIHI